MTSAAPNESPTAESVATGANGPERSGKASEDPGRRPRQDHPDEEAEPELADDEEHEILDAVRVRALDPGDQAERERDRHRVVAARLRLERSREPAADVREAKRREHGGGVGRRDDSAEKDRLEPREVEQRCAATPTSSAVTTTPTVLSIAAGAATPRRRRQDVWSPPSKRMRARPTIPTCARELGVVEVDASRTVRAEQHPEHEERDENRHPGPRGRERRERARGQDRADDEKDEPFVHPRILAARAAA